MTLTVHPSRFQRDGSFGFLTLAFAAAIIRGATGTHRASTYVVVGIIAVLLIVTVAFWIKLRRRPSRLEIGPDLIRFVDPVSKTAERHLRRDGGGVVVGVRHASLRTWVAYISQPDTGTSIDLNSFKVKQVAEVCQAQGWPVTRSSPYRRDRS
jgi:hypothetical protein